MSGSSFKKRLEAVENELASIKTRLNGATQSGKKSWKAIVGSFAGDPLHAQAVKLGRAYRRSQRSKARK